MTFPTEWKVMKFMFQTTNKYIKSPFSMGKSSFSMGKSPTTNQFTYQKNVNFHSCFQKSQLKSHQNSSTIWGSCIPSTLLNGNVWIHQVKHHLLTYKFTYKKTACFMVFTSQKDTSTTIFLRTKTPLAPRKDPGSAARAAPDRSRRSSTGAVSTMRKDQCNCSNYD